MTTLRQAFLNALDGVAYLVDGDGRILEVGEPAWSGSLRRYGAPSGGVRAIIGQCLFDAIHGAEVRCAYQALHRAVLGGERPFVAFEMRCDAPDVRRLLRMSITAPHEPLAPPAVLYQSQLLSAVSRPRVSLFDPQSIVEHVRLDAGLPIVRISSFFHRVAWPVQAPTGWTAAEDYYRLGGPADVRTRHGGCPDCADRVFQRPDAGEALGTGRATPSGTTLDRP